MNEDNLHQRDQKYKVGLYADIRGVPRGGASYDSGVDDTAQAITT